MACTAGKTASISAPCPAPRYGTEKGIKTAADVPGGTGSGGSGTSGTVRGMRCITGKWGRSGAGAYPTYTRGTRGETAHSSS